MNLEIIVTECEEIKNKILTHCRERIAKYAMPYDIEFRVKRRVFVMENSIFIGTIWSLLPPVIAIVLAFITKEVYSSLFIGIITGALLYGQFNPWISFESIFTIMTENIDLNILIFLVMLGMIVILMQKSGGSAAYGRWAAEKIKNKKKSNDK